MALNPIIFPSADILTYLSKIFQAIPICPYTLYKPYIFSIFFIKEFILILEEIIIVIHSCKTEAQLCVIRYVNIINIMS